MKKLIFFLLVFGTSCSSLPEHKNSSENSSDIGVWHTKLPDLQNAFDVFARLPKKEEKKFRRRHLVLAAAKACKEIGQPYFDISGNVFVKAEGSNEITKVLGLCFQKPVMPSMKITFEEKVKVFENYVGYTVESVNEKAPTMLGVGDILVTIGGQPASTNYLHRKIVLKLWQSGKKTVPLEVIRNSKLIKVEEPILDVPNDWSVERVSALNNLYRL